MKWGLLVLIFASIGLVLGSPFIEFFAPDKNIWLVDLTNQGNPNLLASGAETLWYQWQIWLYIGLFCLVVILLGGIILGVILGYIDQEFSEKKRKLDVQQAELNRSKSQFEKEKTQQIMQDLAHERHTIEIMTQEALDTDQHATAALAKAERINKKTNLSHKTQIRENSSKLRQRDRLRDQKLLVIEYLENVEWKLSDGSRITYTMLVNLGQKIRDQRE